jgi:hypothetical protein
MNLRQVFLYYLKEHNIVGIAKTLFQDVNGRRFGRWKYDYPNPAKWISMTFDEYLEENVFIFGLDDLFWTIQPLNHELLKSKKYRKARSGWNNFVRNNVNFSRDYVKEGDEIELINRWDEPIRGTVAFIPPKFSFKIPIMIKRNTRNGYSVKVFEIGNYKKVLINGEEKKLSFSIKKGRKIYA